MECGKKEDDTVSVSSVDSWLDRKSSEEDIKLEEGELPPDEKPRLMSDALQNCKNGLEVGKTLREFLEEPAKIEHICQVLEGLRPTDCFYKLTIPNAFPPLRATSGSVGYDLFSPITQNIPPGQNRIFKIGVAIQTPGSYLHCEIKSRSGLACRKGIEVVGSGIIDTDFHAPICAVLENKSDIGYTVFRGHRIAQLVFRPYIQAKLLPATPFEKMVEMQAEKRAGGNVEAASPVMKKARQVGFGSTGM